MRFELSHDLRDISDEAILGDMNKVAKIVGTTVLREREYEKHGKYAVNTPIRRFGSWASALEKAGLEKSVDRKISDTQLFENLFTIWTRVGRQPTYSHVQKPLSRFHISTYERRFSSWRLALEAFVEWANAMEKKPVSKSTSSSLVRRKTPRNPSLRMRFRVLCRDRFTCCACGLSPSTTPGTILQVDHMTPYSKGGETIEENLQTLCEKCNEGKSDLVID